eukprot:11023204-Ditylum_brightwellii.AAC.1
MDECGFFRGNVIFLCYVSGGFFAAPNQDDIDQAIKDLNNAKFGIEDRGNIKDYLGMTIERLPDGKINITQQQIIQSIIDEVPSISTLKNKGAPESDKKVNYLEKGHRGDISYAAHQWAMLCEDPMETHAAAVEHIARYLEGTKGKGVILNHKANRSFFVYVHVDFSRNWFKKTAINDAAIAKSRTGYIITYVNCPIL